jgi:hypothetical protein
MKGTKGLKARLITESVAKNKGEVAGDILACSTKIL